MAFRRAPSESPADVTPGEGSTLELGLELDLNADPGSTLELEPDTEEADFDALPFGVEPWSGEAMPEGTASNPDADAPAPGASAPSEAPAESAPRADDELNYRRLYETRFRDLELGQREVSARTATGSELFALCLDPSPQIIAALLHNPQFGLAHARQAARHHHSERGLEILARSAQLLHDSQVQRRLLQNAQAPDVVIERVLRQKRLLEVYRSSIDRDLPERNRVRVRARLRPYFTRAEPDDRAALIIKTEGRCLAQLAGCTFDAKTTQILCNFTALTTPFVQNLARFAATPPILIAKLLRSPMVQRQPPLRMLLLRHPNAGSEAKRKG